jgi:hypothetical protein
VFALERAQPNPESPGKIERATAGAARIAVPGRLLAVPPGAWTAVGMLRTEKPDLGTLSPCVPFGELCLDPGGKGVINVHRRAHRSPPRLVDIERLPAI